ncbi:MAG: NADH-quinone oxidoreductase subunit L [Buchnera aphidicola (Periphyllus lyropictus)]|uniref:NADH-quinone oxidoreductase subunit L n=1 Tax=Buchnera aphidicola TaxID=9 RepID=UPI001EC434EA|nr:NADH-quinone oxidoreductase subunit L [Buchnera aphidicola]NIH16681.1 NADH-quinone oxidoreductase subunit L [Buchnera aphidicola (Periphyllus lyropictus)]USS94588.1 NADH-quinone oxidoreductase subunit L [Buchnera aphidicola (Periphyllus lyropictus)]
MNLLFLTILLPFFSFLLIIFSQKKFSNIFYKIIGVFPIFSSFILVNYFYFYNFNNKVYISKIFWNWMTVLDLHVNFGLYIDKLSLNMLQVITGIGFLIHIFSIWYMSYKINISRFFAYTNLFISSMILLVLSNNLLLMYFSWELVGFCSYSLIGFYYTDLKNIKAAMKAFIITKIGDLFILLAIFLIFFKFHTLDFFKLNELFHDFSYKNKEPVFELIALFILIGAISKSAQFPLQTWLLKAMVGPTPVSALIHSATMITAGVYLIIRIHSLFELSDHILYLVSILGSITILISSFSAIFEKDIKKILAYSTMSQIGYMFLGLGMKFWDIVLSHLVVHSFFKALLFLSSGSLIFSCNDKKNITKMGGLRKKLPFLYFCFLFGIFSLISFPYFTSSFYTKGSIIFESFNKGYIYFFIISCFGVFFTSIYSSRILFLIFHGNGTLKVNSVKNFFHDIVLIILCLLSSILGLILFSSLLDISILKDITNNKKNIIEVFLFFLSLIGIFGSYYFFVLKKKNSFKILNNKNYYYFFKFLDKNFGLDFLYKLFFINLFNFIKSLFFIDYIKKITRLSFCVFKNLNNFFITFNNGYLRFYIISILTGTLTILICLLM